MGLDMQEFLVISVETLVLGTSIPICKDVCEQFGRVSFSWDLVSNLKGWVSNEAITWETRPPISCTGSELLVGDKTDDSFSGDDSDKGGDCLERRGDTSAWDTTGEACIIRSGWEQVVVGTVDNDTDADCVTDSREDDTAGSSAEDVECACDWKGGATCIIVDTVAACNADEVVTGVTRTTDVETGVWDVWLAGDGDEKIFNGNVLAWNGDELKAFCTTLSSGWHFVSVIFLTGEHSGDFDLDRLRDFLSELRFCVESFSSFFGDFSAKFSSTICPRADALTKTVFPVDWFSGDADRVLDFLLDLLSAMALSANCLDLDSFFVLVFLDFFDDFDLEWEVFDVFFGDLVPLLDLCLALEWLLVTDLCFLLWSLK